MWMIFISELKKAETYLKTSEMYKNYFMRNFYDKIRSTPITV